MRTRGIKRNIINCILPIQKLCPPLTVLTGVDMKKKIRQWIKIPILYNVFDVDSDGIFFSFQAYSTADDKALPCYNYMPNMPYIRFSFQPFLHKATSTSQRSVFDPIFLIIFDIFFQGQNILNRTMFLHLIATIYTIFLHVCMQLLRWKYCLLFFTVLFSPNFLLF